jgi:hypothetical protein
MLDFLLIGKQTSSALVVLRVIIGLQSYFLFILKMRRDRISNS